MVGKVSRLVLGFVTTAAMLAVGTHAADAATVGTPARPQAVQQAGQDSRLAAELRALPEGQSLPLGTADGRTVGVTKTNGQVAVTVSGPTTLAGSTCVNNISIALIGLGVAAVGTVLFLNPTTPIFLVAGYEVGRGLLTTFVAAGGLTTAVLGFINAVCASLSPTA